MLVAPQRVLKVAVAVRPATLLRFHRAPVRRKYQWLFSASTQRRPGPKGPSKELIAAILEIKRLNPRFGCPRIAQQISHAFGVEIDKDVVRRILANHPLPKSGGNGPSWLSAIAEARDSKSGYPFQTSVEPATVIPSWDRIDGRVGLAFGRFEVYAFGRNLTDERHPTSAFRLAPNISFVQINDPRTYGFGFRYTY